MKTGKKINNLLGLGSAEMTASVIVAFFWLFLASLLSKTEYGELGFLMSIANVASAISLLGARNTITVFESKNDNIFPALFIIILISSSIVAAVSYIFTSNFVLSLLIVGMPMFGILQSVLISKERYKDFSKNIIIRSVIIVVSGLLLYHFFDITGIILAYVFSTLIILKDLHFYLKNKKYNFQLVKSKFRFMVFSYATRLSQVFFKWGDKLVIGSLYGLTILGSYYFAVQFFLILDTIPRAIGNYLTPQESKGRKNKKIKYIIVLISILVTTASVIALPHLVNTFIPKYSESIIVMQIISIALIPLSIIGILQSESLGKGNTKVVFIGSIIQSTLYLILIIVLGQIWELVGLSIGFLISVIVRAIYHFIIRNNLN